MVIKMFKWLLDHNRLLRSKSPPKVKPGDVMVFDDDEKNPFALKPHRVVVLDVKGGYVQYRSYDGYTETKMSKSRSAFAARYKHL